VIWPASEERPSFARALANSARTRILIPRAALQVLLRSILFVIGSSARCKVSSPLSDFSGTVVLLPSQSCSTFVCVSLLMLV
jgi:hypothetical protein